MTHHPDSPTHKSSDEQISYFVFFLVVSTCFKLFIVFQCLISCAGLFSRFFGFLGACWLVCGRLNLWKVFWMVLRSSGPCHSVFGDLLHLVISCFNVFIVVSNCSNRSIFEIGMVCSRLFYFVCSVVFGFFRCVFLFKNVRSPKVGLRGFNLFVVCATLFHVASSRVGAPKCLVVSVVSDLSGVS